MVLGHYEHHVSVSQLRRELTVSADAGTSMAELMTLASDKNMTGRVLKGEITEIESAELPLIAFWRGNHFVVIVKVDGRSVTVHDPASGVRRYSLKEAQKLFSGYVLELKPTPRFDKNPLTRRSRWGGWPINPRAYFSGRCCCLCSRFLPSLPCWPAPLTCS